MTMWKNRQEYYESRHTTHIDVWYDRHIRLWTLQPMDDEKIQTAPVEYAANKKEAMELKAEMERDLIRKDGVK